MKFQTVLLCLASLSFIESSLALQKSKSSLLDKDSALDLQHALDSSPFDKMPVEFKTGSDK